MSQGRKRTERPPHYAAYLLRLWREKSGESAEWRASLQDPHSAERVGFASLADLFEFLESETGSSSPRTEQADN